MSSEPRSIRPPALGLPARRSLLTLPFVLGFGSMGHLGLLGALAATVGLSGAAWVVGVACGAALLLGVARGVAASGRERVGPADVVTLFRGLLACGAAALTVESLLGDPVVPALLVLVVPALALDAVDGWVARRTASTTEFGGRFDGEVDAFLILVLSIVVAPALGWWVLSAGLVRYAFGAAAWVLPWMRRPLPFRYWRKVVTATVGITLAVAAADVLPRPVTVGGVVVAHVLLAESFGRDVWWLWRRRAASTPLASAGRVIPTALALGLVWVALLAPTRPDHLTPWVFLRIPLEALVLAGLVLALPTRWSRSATLLVGTFLGLLTLLKVLDLGAYTVLDRPFDVVTDRALLGSGLGFVDESLGTWAVVGAVLGAAVLVLGVAVLLPLAVRRLARTVTGHRRVATGLVGLLTVTWLVAAATQTRFGSGGPVAAAEVAPFAVGKVSAALDARRGQQEFRATLAADAFRTSAPGDLAALSGKDVVLAFVESYGRVAVEGPDAGPVQQLLDAGTTTLAASGYTARSAFLRSTTFGGSSWLAHATLKSGIPVTDQWRYGELLSSDRATLTSVFGRSGWRTAAVMPSDRRPWPEGQAFYGFDRVYDRSSLGYAGPAFGFSAMPDQFALTALSRLELGTSNRAPVMAEIVLTSSHGPWAPLPTTVGPAALGDGSVFTGIRERAVTAKELWSDRADVPGAYRSSIAYSLASVVSFVEQHTDDDLVLVLLGDHQPSTIVSGFGGNRDVPVTVLARDPAVLDRISGWGWDEGLRPRQDAPVWPMEAFRDRFLTAFRDRSAPAGPEDDDPRG